MRNAGSGVALIQELRDQLRIQEIKPKGDKQSRLRDQTPAFANGHVHLPRDAAWLNDYIAALTSFPIIIRSRAIRSIPRLQALAWIGQNNAEPNALVAIKYLNARALMSQGYSREAAAAEAGVSVEQLREVDSERKRAAEREEAALRERNRKFCFRCNKEIDTSESYTPGVMDQVFPQRMRSTRGKGQ